MTLSIYSEVNGTSSIHNSIWAFGRLVFGIQSRVRKLSTFQTSLYSLNPYKSLWRWDKTLATLSGRFVTCAYFGMLEIIFGYFELHVTVTKNVGFPNLVHIHIASLYPCFKARGLPINDDERITKVPIEPTQYHVLHIFIDILVAIDMEVIMVKSRPLKPI